MQIAVNKPTPRLSTKVHNKPPTTGIVVTLMAAQIASPANILVSVTAKLQISRKGHAVTLPSTNADAPNEFCNVGFNSIDF